MTDKTANAALPFSPLIGVPPLMRMAFLKQDVASLGIALLERAQANPTDANAYLDCSTYLQITGDREVALKLQLEAIRMRQLYSIAAARQDGNGLRLLVIMGPGDLMSNMPVEFLLEDSDVSLDLLYLTLESDWPNVVPEHDVMLVALAESEANRPLLARLASFIEHWPRPVINRPERIAVLSRDGVCAALANVAGLDMPVTARIDRATLAALGDGRTAVGAVLPGDGFPLIVRPIGSHAGADLEKMAAPADIAGYLARVGAERFYVSRFVDYSSADGQFRKYRIVLIDGRPFICHFAVSSHWMIHYLNAGMHESAAKRAEEAVAMAGFDAGFARRHAEALRTIDQRMGLPYLGIDCAETPAGELLIFEVDNAMIVHAMDPEDMYPYKKPAMQKVFDAFRRMLEQTRRKAAAG
ncbi:MAG TPA: RimK family alpha-L-glutamate ligase [Janthinobacterium sp.]|jgi:glutathione synthase/RimK-type ligase-like ATP-grasp enzyme|nr:RimK family alpha-L-glutamate ligase [Janthinobacterium sp.]